MSSAYYPPQCQKCADFWVHSGRPMDTYLLVSRGNHIPGVHDESQSSADDRHHRQIGAGHIPDAHAKSSLAPDQVRESVAPPSFGESLASFEKSSSPISAQPQITKHQPVDDNRDYAQEKENTSAHRVRRGRPKIFEREVKKSGRPKDECLAVSAGDHIPAVHDKSAAALAKDDDDDDDARDQLMGDRKSAEMSAVSLDCCQVCVKYWARGGCSMDGYRIVSIGGHIPGAHGESSLAPEQFREAVAPPSSGESLASFEISSSTISGQPQISKHQQVDDYCDLEVPRGRPKYERCSVSVGDHIPGVHDESAVAAATDEGESASSTPEGVCPATSEMPSSPILSQLQDTSCERADDTYDQLPAIQFDKIRVMEEACSPPRRCSLLDKIFQVVGNPFNQGRSSLHAEIAIEEEDLRNEENLRNEVNQSNPLPSNEIRDEETMEKHLKLQSAVLTGNWVGAKDIGEFNKPITLRRETALHIATMFEQTEFAKKLIIEMDPRGLQMVDQDNHTALCLAAINNNKEIMNAILNHHPNLAFKDETGTLPLFRVAFSGCNKEMVKHLYQLTKGSLKDDDFPDLLVALLEADVFDVVLEMLTEDRVHLATKKCKYTGETAFHVMAHKPNMFSKKVGHWRKLFSAFAQDVQNCKAHALLQRIWRTMLSDSEGNWRTIFVAVEQGNLEFLRVLIRTYPELVTKTDNEKGWTIFHVAVVHRQQKIFALIHEIGLFKKVVAKYLDKEGNNMLHLAAKLAPESRLETVPGAALQLQLELLWFQEVKDVVGPQVAEARTIKANAVEDQKTARESFIKNHEDLIKKGEKWMRNTANSCIIVAVLVATVAFAAAFTLPGGNDQNTGIPILLHSVPLKIFVVADAISFICSTTSVLTFLSVLTSTYALDDFIWSLPRKLLVGLSTLFFSLMAMMAAFVTSFFVYFQQRRALQLFYPLPMTCFTLVPLILFFFYHLGIFTGMMMSICKCKRNSLFRPDHCDPLFPVVETGLCKPSKYFSFLNCCLCRVWSTTIGFKKS